MKNILSVIAGLFLTVSLFAQAPQKMSYQAVVRNSSNTLVTSTPVGMKISILQGSAFGTAVYVETQNPSTNANGLVSLEIGAGTPVTGTFASIDWATGPYFIKTETDPTGGTSYTISGTNELMSVPYALSSGDNKWAANAYGINNIGSGNVGVGTSSPFYKFDVEHGGATGIRSKSTSFFSVVDIDAADGDAALRFQEAGVSQWLTRNRPFDDYYEIFEFGGGGSRFVIQDATGFVGIGGLGATNAPAYQLDIEHGGANGIHCKSTNGFSVIDIDAADGDANLRFQKAGSIQWNVRTSPTTDALQFYEYGMAERMRIDRTTGKVWVNGDFTALGIKAFTMDHPLDPENKLLIHAAVESNEVINFYSGNIVTDASGKATVTLPDYFEAINKDFRYQLTVVGTFAQAIISKEVTNNTFEIATNQPNVKVSWEVKGVRNDARMQQQPFSAVQEKTAAQKGKYVDPETHHQPQSKGFGYDANKESSLSPVKTTPTTKKITENPGESTDTTIKVIPKSTVKPISSEKQSID